ncbi:hypothetical protein ABE504_32925 [Paenibacillus oryzisoli]|uniref:hypothetical protein n=1 Tax=Paenibacillus oryzisoli TaxID=1850517 RepID=UPI003D274147
MRRFLYSANGAVSVYLILIIVPIFIFQAVLIDFARIQTASQESQIAVDAAARSVLSAFDPKLQQYGLYAVAQPQPESQAIFEEMFTNNLSGAVTATRLHWADTKPVDGTLRLTPVYALSSHVVFKQQVLEDMKIKAPIEFTLEIADKFTKQGMTEPFRFGSSFTQKAAEIERRIEEREQKLDEAWDTSEKLYKKLAGYHTDYAKRIAELDALASRIGLHTADEVRSEIANVRSQLESLYASMRDIDASIASLARAGEAAAAGIQSLTASKQTLANQVSQLSQKMNDLEQLLQDIVTYASLLAATKLEASSQVKVVQQLQQEVEGLLREAKTINEDIRSKVGAAGQASANSANDVFSHVAVLGEAYFYEYQTGIAGMTALFAAFEAKMANIYLFTGDKTAEANQANDAYGDASTSFYAKQQPLEQARIGANEAAQSQKNDQRSKIQNVLDKAKQAIGGCSITGVADGDSDLYDKLQGEGQSNGFFQKYMTVNRQTASFGSEIPVETEKAEPFALHAMSLLEAFNQAAAVVRDELYLNEYGLTKFNYRTYGLEKDRSGDVKKANALTDPAAHALAAQEAEYLLYGFSSCTANMASAYGEMFAFRAAIRTLEALLDPKKELLNIGSPMLVLLVAAAEGTVKAYQDMSQLVKGEAVELSAKLGGKALTLTYKDYLRIFMMLHSNNSKLLARMQSLIELNSRVDLTQTTTYLQANAVSELRLWFIPQVMKLLDGTGLLTCKVQGTSCQFHTSTVVSY